MSLWKLLTATYDGTNFAKVRIDKSTDTLQSISYQHHELHGGSDYDITEVFDLPADDVLDIQISTPAGTKLAHFTIDFFTEKSVEWWLYENVVINTPGTGITPKNHRRDAGDNSILTVAYIINTSIANANSDTAIVGATQLPHGKTGEAGAKKESGSGGGGDSREEWVLLPDTDYSLRFFDLGDSGFVAVHLDWYEHTDKHL